MSQGRGSTGTSVGGDDTGAASGLEDTVGAAPDRTTDAATGLADTAVSGLSRTATGTLGLDATAHAGKVGAAAHPDAQARRLGRYQLIRRLGEGGMGVVYEARDPHLERPVALKLLHPRYRGHAVDSLKERLLREARAMAALSHPNVVPVFEAGTAGDQLYLAMELVRGTDLKSWLRASHPWRAVLGMFVQAGEGLLAAHRRGLVHRDFKPANVLVGDDGRARVGDFGLVRAELGSGDSPALGGPGTEGELTGAGDTVGTPAYMAPELHDRGDATAASDQYAFCVALWEGLYGQHPFGGTSIAELFDNAARGVVREPSRRARVPSRVRAALMRGMRPRPEDRWPGMAALLAVLRRAQGRTRRTGAVAALGVALCATTGYALLRPAAAPCADVGAEAAAAWAPAVAARAEQAFAATTLPFAADSFARVDAHLRAYLDEWTATRRTVCEDTRERGVQSEQLLDLRMACLDRKLRRARALIAELGRADAALVTAAVDAVAALDRLADCTADAGALEIAQQLPQDETLRAEVIDVRAHLDDVDGLVKAGKVGAARETLEPMPLS